MYQPSTACVDKEGRLEVSSLTKTLVPRGARGVALKSNFSVDGCVGGKARVCAGRSEEVESDHGLGNETIPFLGWKVGVAGGESGAKMISECVYRRFGGVVAVGVWGNNLEVNILIAEGFMHGVVALVVEDVDSGGCTVLL